MASPSLRLLRGQRLRWRKLLALTLRTVPRARQRSVSRRRDTRRACTPDCRGSARATQKSFSAAFRSSRETFTPSQGTCAAYLPADGMRGEARPAVRDGPGTTRRPATHRPTGSPASIAQSPLCILGLRGNGTGGYWHGGRLQNPACSGGFTDDQAAGELVKSVAGAAPDVIEELARRQLAKLRQAHVHCGQRRAGRRGEHVPVVVADQRDIVRHPEAGIAERVRDAPGDLVTAAEDRLGAGRSVQHRVRCLPAPLLTPLPVEHLASG